MMNQDNLAREFTFERDRRERRVAKNLHPPYMTEEGFVLIDRRENVDRRAARRLPANESSMTANGAAEADWLPTVEKEPLPCPIADIMMWRTAPPSE